MPHLPKITYPLFTFDRARIAPKCCSLDSNKSLLDLRALQAQQAGPFQALRSSRNRPEAWLGFAEVLRTIMWNNKFVLYVRRGTSSSPQLREQTCCSCTNKQLFSVDFATLSLLQQLFVCCRLDQQADLTAESARETRLFVSHARGEFHSPLGTPP